MSAHISKALGGLLALAAGDASGATLKNLDAEPFVLVVTERGEKTEIRLLEGQSIDFCFEGCFVTLANGDRAALLGDENVEISGGRILRKK